MIVKLNYFSDNNIIDLFNSLLPDNYFIYRTGFSDAKCLARGCPTVTMEVKDVENEKQ